MTINGNDTIDIDPEGPGMGIDDIKRKDTGDVFETTLSVDQCKRILRATARHDVNFRSLTAGGKMMSLNDSMKKDRWVWTDADPIRLHLHVPSGEVVCSDGQHRINAAVLARRTLHCLVLWGDRWKAGIHVDRNRNRNVSQFLKHEHGMGSATVYVAAARLHLGRIIAYQENYQTNYARLLVDDEAIVDWILKNQEALVWAVNRGAIGGGRGFSITGYHVFLVELYLVNPEAAEAFHEDMKNPDLDLGDPLAQLRRSVGRRYSDTGIRATVDYTLNNLVKAYNMRSAGDTVSKWVNNSSDELMLPAGFKIDGKKVRTTR